MSTVPIQFFNRYTQNIETEAIYGEAYLRWAYENPLGRLSVEAVVKRMIFSHWYGWRMNLPKSRDRIQSFVESFGLDANEFEKTLDEFDHFNDFFARKLKPSARPIAPEADTVTFPADGRHLGFQDLSRVSGVFVKVQRFDLEALFHSQELAQRYQKGSAVLSRLCPTDYHRFHFSTDGVPAPSLRMPGPLYSVSPIALRQNLAYLWQNKRELTQIQSPGLGTVTIVEFGATNVGSIKQTYSPNRAVSKGDEKGFFSFGGSATMTFFEPERVELSPDLVEHSRLQREVYARMGDVMGHKIA